MKDEIDTFFQDTYRELGSIHAGPDNAENYKNGVQLVNSMINTMKERGWLSELEIADLRGFCFHERRGFKPAELSANQMMKGMVK